MEEKLQFLRQLPHTQALRPQPGVPGPLLLNTFQLHWGGTESARSTT